MAKVNDYIYRAQESQAAYHVRVYQVEGQLTIVLYEPVAQPASGGAVCQLAAAVWQHAGQPRHCIWIEHQPSAAQSRFGLVNFVRQPDCFHQLGWFPFTREWAEKLIGETISLGQPPAQLA